MPDLCCWLNVLLILWVACRHQGKLKGESGSVDLLKHSGRSYLELRDLAEVC